MATCNFFVLKYKILIANEMFVVCICDLNCELVSLQQRLSHMLKTVWPQISSFLKSQWTHPLILWPLGPLRCGAHLNITPRPAAAHTIHLSPHRSADFAPIHPIWVPHAHTDVWKVGYVRTLSDLFCFLGCIC